MCVMFIYVFMFDATNTRAHPSSKIICFITFAWLWPNQPAIKGASLKPNAPQSTNRLNGLDMSRVWLSMMCGHIVCERKSLYYVYLAVGMFVESIWIELMPVFVFSINQEIHY